MNDPAWSSPKPISPSARRDFWFAFALIGTVFATLAMLTWRKWPDLLVDFGLQLYCPWKLSTGSVLYRDIAYLDGGPLSQYYHALLFKIFGVSLMTLAVSNLLLAILLLLVIYRCFYQSAGQLTAITACLAMVTVFAFGQYNLAGIFNYITPYCSEIVHGLVLSVFTVALLAKWFREEKLWLASAIGFGCGLTFLTKPEVFLALGASVAAGLALFWQVRKKSRFLLCSLGAMIAASLLPLTAFFVYFWRMTDFREAGQSVCAGWLPLLKTHPAESPYFRWCLGLDTPGAHLQLMFFHCCGVALIVAAAAWVCRRRERVVFNRILFFLAAAGLAALARNWEWRDCGQSLPVLCLALLGLLLWRAKVSGLESDAVFPILWTVFSLGLLVKLGLFSRFWHYGFVLGMPAFLGAIYLVLWLLPRELERCNVQPGFFRALLCLPLLIGFVELTLHSMTFYDSKTVPVDAGGDKMWVYPPQIRPDETGIIMAVHWMETHTPPQATLAVLPAGMMINYLTHQTNPCHYPIWPPPEVAAFGQEKMTDDFIRHSPDYIILIRLGFFEHGVQYFGLQKKFGGDLMQWINTHYTLKCLIGDDWLRNGRFGIKILQKKPD